MLDRLNALASDSSSLTKPEQRTTSSKLKPKYKSPLLNVPPEIHHLIFRHLHKVDSVCLGLSSRVLYPIHWKIYGKVRLSTVVFHRMCVDVGGGMHVWPWCLGQVLKQWIGPKWKLSLPKDIFERAEEGIEEEEKVWSEWGIWGLHTEVGR